MIGSWGPADTAINGRVLEDAIRGGGRYIDTRASVLVRSNLMRGQA